MRLLARRPQLLLLTVLIVGLILRFLNLTGKPLWMDEVITSIFSLGQTYDAIPIGKTQTVAELTKFLSFNANATCQDITTNVMTQSVHPPVFFCAMHHWLNLMQNTGINLVWQLRSMAALLGVAAISIAYAIGRKAFRSNRIGLASGGVMAVSPFAIYLSQEARHYTLPMLIVMLGLLSLIHIQQDWQQGKINPLIWVGWAACQTIGLYTHYFCLMATVGQIGALLLWQWWQHPTKKRPTKMFWVPVAFVVSTIGFTYAPWIATIVSHVTRPETNWMKPFEPSFVTFLAPLWQLPIGWLSMIVAFPVEGQPLWVVIPTAIFTIGFGGWIVYQAYQGLKLLWAESATRDGVMLISVFLSIILIEFFAIIFVLGKDISQVPRYNFIYYPAIALLLGAGLSRQIQPTKLTELSGPFFYLMLVGLLSGLFINTNLAFQKPFRPAEVAGHIAPITPRKAMVVMAYQDYQELALGMGFVLALRDVNPQVKFLFLNRVKGYEPVMKIFPSLPNVDDFWLIGPGLRQKDFPNLAQVGKRRCSRQADRYHRLGLPYQGYKCE
ncbi:hypothetical protein IQ266_11270 [filamentous cyanobacterium LEGE 11480]|uniref:Glycosyltransferase RgtA/B/C/D-like domain-containing protein n=1 Tax=Romeriopsis navalis LEGE 11480 TaxID=2777977 RepID=A0A928VMG4_9CYAN|nr:hypothetical protein [Romeriopsis navalis]MBE9030312.1 hypothetical protein [Romeriopsis navalis LEGE 11480]